MKLQLIKYFMDKKLAKFLNHPSSFDYRQIENILIRLGFEKIYAKGSHQKFKHPRLTHDLIIPMHHHDCKDFYKILTAKIIRENQLGD